MSKRSRRRRRQRKNKRHYVSVPCAQVELTEHNGRRFVTGLSLPQVSGQWLWRRVTNNAPPWCAIDTGASSSAEEAHYEFANVNDTESTTWPNDDSEIVDEDIDLALVADALRTLVHRTIERRDMEAARRLDDAFEAVTDEEAAGFSFTYVVGQLMLWLTGSKEILDTKDAADALDWVRENLGIAAFRKSMAFSGFLRHPLADPAMTVNDAFDQVMDDPISPLIWLTAGVVAVAADGDVNWLRQFDRHH